jgi:serine/threonine protein kinase
MAFSLQDYSGFKKIGEGGMGKVFLATQISLDRKVVIKEIAADLLKNPALVQRFENEAKLAASLEHDNIIRVYDFGADSGFFYIAMEYIDGPNLEHLLTTQGFPKEVGLMVVLQALKGLSYAHQHGIAHGDVKPDNILISKTGKVKLTDFGLSYLNAQTADFPIADMVFLTPAYMPPEQAKEIEAQHLDKEDFYETIPAFAQPRIVASLIETDSEQQNMRKDIWSVGVMLYRILSGTFPFSGENISRLAHSIEHENLTPIRKFVPYLPEKLEEYIDRCLRKEPGDRLLTLDSLIEPLENLFFDIGIRDIEKQIGKYLAEGAAAVVELEKLLSGYHIRLSEEYLAGGDAFKSDIHFKEAEKANPSAGRAPANGRPGKALPSRTSITQSVPVVKIRNSSKTGKSGVFTAFARNSAIMLIALLGAAGLFAIVKINSAEGGGAESVKGAAETLRDTVRQQQAPAETASPSADSLHPADYPLPLSEDTAHRLQEIARLEYMRKNRSILSSSGLTSRTASVQTGTLKIAAVPFPARVYVDGNENTSPEKLNRGVLLPAGVHVIAAAAEGYESYLDLITIVKDSVINFQIELKPLGKTSSILDVSCYPQSTIYVDGIARGRTPKTVSLSEGKHFVILHRDGYESFSQAVEVLPEKPVQLQIRLEKQQ